MILYIIFCVLFTMGYISASKNKILNRHLLISPLIVPIIIGELVYKLLNKE